MPAARFSIYSNNLTIRGEEAEQFNVQTVTFQLKKSTGSLRLNAGITEKASVIVDSITAGLSAPGEKQLKEDKTAKKTLPHNQEKT